MLGALARSRVGCSRFLQLLSGSQLRPNWRRAPALLRVAGESKCRNKKSYQRKEDLMKRNPLLSACGIVLFVACALAAAQEKAGTLASIDFQKPKSGMVPQYEAGRKQKAAWHKQQNDPQPLLVWETLTGDNTGTYLVGRFGQHWTDMDKPAIPDESDHAEFQKILGNYVDSVVSRYYEFLPKISNVP